MKSIFDKEVRNELISRINSLSENSHAQWGKMNAYQMLKHCSLAEEMYLGKRTYKRVFLGYIFGKMALKEMTKDETPLARNARTSPIFVVTDNGDLNEQKNRLITLIKEYEFFKNDKITHWFFGDMTKEQVGVFSYKHIDHHLRQFNT